MIELLSRGEDKPLRPEDIVRKALERDSATLRVVDDAGLAVGRALGNVANLINPEVIVVGGPLAGLGELLLDRSGAAWSATRSPSSARPPP